MVVEDLWSEVSGLRHPISASYFSGWTVGGTGQSRVMSAMCKSHHSLCQVTMRTPSFYTGRAGKFVQQCFPFHIVVRDKSVLVSLQACVFIIIFSP